MVAVAPDGSGFISTMPTATSPEWSINVVLNWFEELKQLVPTGGR